VGASKRRNFPLGMGMKKLTLKFEEVGIKDIGIAGGKNASLG
jgi:hypothetical protein